MTIIVCVKINDGIIVASDSTTSFFRNDDKFVQSYDSASKIFNLYKGLPIGAATCGTGNIGNASIATLSKDFRETLQNELPPARSDSFNPKNYTIQEISIKARAFFLQTVAETTQNIWLTYWIFGYSTNRSLPEIWSINIRGRDCDEPTLMASETWNGCRWDGEREALDRLILGYTPELTRSAVLAGADETTVAEILDKIAPDLYETLVLPAMPIQDAIDLSQYLVDATTGFMKFSVGRARTAGGPTEIAVVTKHESFKWIARKQFYKVEYNR